VNFFTVRGVRYVSIVIRALTQERLAEGAEASRLDEGLDRALDRAEDRPQLRADTEIGAFTTRWGERYAIAHNPRSGAYLRLNGDEGDLAARLDGSRTLGELLADDLGDDWGLAPEQVADLVAILREGGLLEQSIVDTYDKLQEKLLSAHARASRRAWRWLRKQTISIPRADAFVGAVYRRGGKLLFTWQSNVLAVVGMILGLVAFVAIGSRNGFLFVGNVSTGTAASLFGFLLLALFVHEMGHALAVRHAGRRVINAGFQLYLGHPAFFIDSSDMLLASRRARAINALAGPYTEAVVAGLASIAAWVWWEGATGPLLFRLAGVTYLNALLNLIPFIELDGYWLLTDLLDTPRLRSRSFAVLRYELPDRLRGRREKFSAAERGLIAFGIGGVVFTAAALYTAWALWGSVAKRLLTGLWNAGLGGRVALVLLAVLVFGPLAHAAGDAVSGVVRRVGGLIGDLRFRAQGPWRVEAANAIVRLPIVGDLDDEQLSDLAGRVARRRFQSGAVVVRQGEAPDAFFIVRKGRFAVVERDADGKERHLRRADEGESFGELALLEGRPRTATVRAESDGELFVVDAGTFQRILAPTMSTPELSPAVGPMLEVWALPPFRNFGQRDASLVAEHGEWINFGPGEEIVRQGETGDGFYVLAAGQAEVVKDGERSAVLHAGDHFGEVALLHDVPRTATVRALTHARVLCVDAHAFRTLVAAAFGSGEVKVATDAYKTSGAH
jgi:putative peptide zinc metalloprotease protein